MMFDDRNRPPMFDDQMWAPTTVGIATNGIAPRRPCGCPQGTSVTCPMHPPGPGVFDVMQRVTVDAEAGRNDAREQR